VILPCTVLEPVDEQVCEATDGVAFDAKKKSEA
jgi:hypothetical protein